MDYFKILNLEKEPFSNSPDPDFFYRSRQHLDCLQKIELSVRLRRGLNLVVGDVGTGKTTLCRQIIRNFASDDKIDTHLILDPDFGSPLEFLVTVADIFNGEKPDKDAGERQIKEIIKQNIFRRGVDEQKIIVLIIDEGQKIPFPCLEILREFLNFETNQHKLLQIVIFAQKEIEKQLENYKNFADRINLYHILRPMNFFDTKAMIEYRLEKSAQYSGRVFNPFSRLALWTIYRFTGGYPRKIVTLCHISLLAMIIQNRTTAGLRLVRSCVKRSLPSQYRKRFPAFAAVLLICITSVLFIYKLRPEILNPLFSAVSQVREAFLPQPDSGFRTAVILEPAEAPENIILNKLEDTAALDPEPAAREPETTDDQQAAENAPLVSAPVPEESILPIKPAAGKNNYAPQPTLLGSVRLKKDETLWRLLEKIYGLCTPEHLKAVLLMNPGIKNQDHVEVGQKITLPAIALEKRIFPSGARLVKLEEKQSLSEAVEYCRSHRGVTPPVRLFLYWNKEDGLKYTICLRKIFTDQESALKHCNSLPMGGEVLTLSDDMIFFTDPVPGTGDGRMTN
jgi:general secretion pathway protein A